MTLRIATPLLTSLAALSALALAACAGTDPAGTPVDATGPDVADPIDAPPPIDAPDGTCATDARGTACVIALHAEVRAACDPAKLAALTAALDARRGALPLWHAGTALFVSDGEVAVAGAWNGWVTSATRTSAVCGSALHTATAVVDTGHHAYKLVAGSTWMLDPRNDAFAYDDFEGNPDDRNSVLNTPDSGRGHLVARRAPVCSTALGNCREMLAYLPPGYASPAAADRRYPVLYLHDGQNVFDDHDCCFGHTGWEVNVTLDAEIAAGRVAPIVVVATAHGGAARNDEYGWSTSVGGAQEPFMDFQLEVVQPTAEAAWRIDPARRVVGGSSLGGLISMRLALEHPAVYAGVASISGAFWPGQDTMTSLGHRLPSIGKVPMAIYMDHGGTAAGGGDGYGDNRAVRDQLDGLGWSVSLSPACTPGPDTVCYHHEHGATHDELAWRDRAWRWLRYFFAP